MEICTLASGSSGNCAFVSSGGTSILVDAGISMRRINSCLGTFGLTLRGISAILITHEHSDHISALRMINKYYGIPIFATAPTADAIARMYPELSGAVYSFEPGAVLDIGGLKAASFPTPHDAASSVGYRISDGSKSLVIATDMGYVTNSIYRASVGADFAVIESNHDVDMLNSGIYPYYLKRRILSENGHLSNSDCARLITALAKTGTRHFLLAHLSRENNTPETAYKTVEEALAKENLIIGKNVFLDVAPADEMTARYIL